MSATTTDGVRPLSVALIARARAARRAFRTALVMAIAAMTVMAGQTTANLCETQREDVSRPPSPIDAPRRVDRACAWPSSDGTSYAVSIGMGKVCETDAGLDSCHRMATGYWIDRGWYDLQDRWQYVFLDQFRYRSLGTLHHGRVGRRDALSFPYGDLGICDRSVSAPRHVLASSNLDYAVPWSWTTGDYLDRWRYTVLDQGRYQFLDVTQYNLLGSFRDVWWRCSHGLCSDKADALPLRWAKPPCERCPAIPEPCTAALFTMGALIVLRWRRREGDAIAIRTIAGSRENHPLSSYR